MNVCPTVIVNTLRDAFVYVLQPAFGWRYTLRRYVDEKETELAYTLSEVMFSPKIRSVFPRTVGRRCWVPRSENLELITIRM